MSRKVFMYPTVGFLSALVEPVPMNIGIAYLYFLFSIQQVNQKLQITNFKLPTHNV